ncbi:Uncharacterised protein [Mycobacteroides abscessus]|nr:Uncharacterised protein [Mycobacteroides abscessus]
MSSTARSVARWGTVRASSTTSGRASFATNWQNVWLRGVRRADWYGSGTPCAPGSTASSSRTSVTSADDTPSCRCTSRAKRSNDSSAAGSASPAWTSSWIAWASVMVQYHRDEPGQTAQPAQRGAAPGVKSDRRERRGQVLRVPLVRRRHDGGRPPSRVAR